MVWLKTISKLKCLFTKTLLMCDRTSTGLYLLRCFILTTERVEFVLFKK